MKKLASALLLAGSLGFSATAVQAQAFESTEDAIEYRQAAFKLIGNVFGGRLAPVAREEVDFNAEEVENNAEILKVLISLPWVAFEDETKGGDTKDSVWSNKADFDQKAEDSVVAVKELEEAAESGDLGKFKAAFGKVGQSCKACHDAYRK